MKHNWYPWIIWLGIGLLCAGFMFWMRGHLVRTVAMMEQAPPLLLIDPGHGGEDGGAVSVTGMPESRINLQISRKLDQFLRLLGFRTFLLRTEDVSLHSGTCGTITEKKVSDLKNRVAMVNARQPGILISIHQNHFSDAKYSGAQVFYAKTAGSKELAEHIQQTLRQTLDPRNRRQIKPASSVYLMEHILCPGVLIECGFLSHPEEEQLLQDQVYQRKIVSAIANALTQYAEEREQYGEI